MRCSVDTLSPFVISGWSLDIVSGCTHEVCSYKHLLCYYQCTFPHTLSLSSHVCCFPISILMEIFQCGVNPSIVLSIIAYHDKARSTEPEKLERLSVRYLKLASLKSVCWSSKSARPSSQYASILSRSHQLPPVTSLANILLL